MKIQFDDGRFETIYLRDGVIAFLIIALAVVGCL